MDEVDIGHGNRSSWKSGQEERIYWDLLTADNSFQKGCMGMLSDLIEIVNHEVVCLFVF